MQSMRFWWAGFAAPFGGANALGSHHLVEAMKDAFALRMQLGDPGPDNAYLDLDPVLHDMLSLRFANQLQWVYASGMPAVTLLVGHKRLPYKCTYCTARYWFGCIHYILLCSRLCVRFIWADLALSPFETT